MNDDNVFDEFTEEDALRAEEDELVAADESIQAAIDRETEGGDYDDFDEEDFHGSHPINEPDED